jgi:hypothetical protein
VKILLAREAPAKYVPGVLQACAIIGSAGRLGDSMHLMRFLMKSALIALFISSATAAALPDISPVGAFSILTGKEKLHYYFKSTYGPETITFNLAGSAINQARDYVPEWGQGMSGYGKRFASSLGHKAIKSSLHLGMGALLHEDPRYFSSGRSQIWRRTLYATGQVFVAHKDSGGLRPSYSRFAGIAGGALISRQWFPDAEDRTATRYASVCAISLGLDMARNVFSEFWPDIKKLFRK